MFRRPRHVAIAVCLQSLNHSLLEKCGAAFAGGTAAALTNGEFRESVDIDFLVSDSAGYSALRSGVRGNGFAHLLNPHQNQVTTWSEFRADQYGIRGYVAVGSEQIKFEVVFESRLAIKPVLINEVLGSLPTLSRVQLGATKMLANSDRHADTSTFSRDILDLAFMDLKAKEFHAALAEASTAYGDQARADIAAALETLIRTPGRLDRCLTALSFEAPKAVALQKLNHLKNLLGMSHAN